MNAGIQGLAADIFKVALVRLDRALEDAGMAARLILQVHDEVILEVPPARRRRAADGGGWSVRRPGGRRRRPVRGQRHRAMVEPRPGAARRWADAKWLSAVAGLRVARGALASRPSPPTRAGLPAVLVHEGHRPGGRVPGRRPGLWRRAMRVLDVGCGPGRHARALAARGIEVVGRRHQRALRRAGPRRAPPSPRSCAATPASCATTASSTPPSRCARGRSGSCPGEDGEVLRRMVRASAARAGGRR